MTTKVPGGGLWQAIRHAFAIPQDHGLSEEERDWLGRIADRVVRRELAVPAVFVLQSAKPLSFVGSQTVAFFKPIITLIFAPELCDKVIDLLGRRGTAEELIRMVEERERGGDGQTERP
jgi:hypothetical protein